MPSLNCKELDCCNFAAGYSSTTDSREMGGKRNKEVVNDNGIDVRKILFYWYYNSVVVNKVVFYSRYSL